MHLSVDVSSDDLGLADRELEAFAAHQFDKDRELELAAPLHFPGIRPLGREHADGDVPDELLLESCENHARREACAVLSRERRGVDADRHGEARLVHADHGQRAGIVRVGKRLADRDLGDAGDRDQLAGPGLLGLDAVERLRHEELGDLDARDLTVRAAPRDLLALANRPFADTAEREPPQVRRCVQVRDVRLQRVTLFVGGCGNSFEQHVEEWV